MCRGIVVNTGAEHCDNHCRNAEKPHSNRVVADHVIAPF
jgi:hypothetical protein